MDWDKREKKVDPNFKRSIFESLGFDAELCPVCNSHLKDGVCLNACHLTSKQKRMFRKQMDEIKRR